VLLAHGFSYDQLGDLVFDRLAMMLPTVTPVAGREKIVVRVQITAAGGRRSRNEPQLTRSNCHASIQGVMKSPKRARTQSSDPEFGAGRRRPDAGRQRGYPIHGPKD
jgi:hypothetical protein